MADRDYESTLNTHYGRQGLADLILDGLREAGKDLKAITSDDLSPVAEFHIGGQAATLELAQLAVRFDSVVAENERALNAVKTSHDRLLRAIVDAVAEKRSSQKAYTAKGALDNPQRTRTAETLSLSIDQRL